jgi:thymidylate synthase
MKYKNATEAFESLFHIIKESGEDFANTKALFNQSFTIKNVNEKVITTPQRKFKEEYAEYEYNWYKAGNRDATAIAEMAKIWKSMMAPDSVEVVSNYGFFWKKNNQLDRCIEELNRNRETRRAVVLHYDIDELDKYKWDTPCNIALNFTIKNNKLHLTVFARSIDLVFGFCNDQYTFARLMEEIAPKVNCELGEMHFFITNLHIYPRHYNML